MNILFLTKYSRKGASSRYRTYQYLPFLSKHQIDFEVKPFFSDAYLNAKYSGDFRWIGFMLLAYLRRMIDLFKIQKYDLVVIEYEALPYIPAWVEQFFYRTKVPYVVDYDDAIFHQYDKHRLSLIRSLLGGKIAKLMRGAKFVVAGNPYLADYAKQAGASSVGLIPTVIDLNKYVAKQYRPNSDQIVIGWIGSPSTAIYLSHIESALSALCKQANVRLKLIGSGPIELKGVDCEIVEWSELSEIEHIKSFDIGIMPLPDEPWARGKCGFKLIQYMACGIPVVASPVGVNCDLVKVGENGYLASSHEEWVAYLTMMIQERERLPVMGSVGRQLVADHYCLDVTTPKLLNLLRS